LWLYCAWLSQRCDQPTVFQPLFTLGLAFVHNFTLPAAFQVFVHFIEPIGGLYLPKEQLTPALHLCIGTTLREVVQGIDPAWEITPTQCRKWSLSRVSSLFSQMSPRASKEIVFDFLVIYGAHFVVYLEAAWLLMNKAKVQADRCSADKENAAIEDPNKWLAMAALVFQRTTPELRDKVRVTVYAPYDPS
jgi:hypothetical protein